MEAEPWRLLTILHPRLTTPPVEYFHLRGAGVKIEQIQHGPFAGIAYRW